MPKEPFKVGDRVRIKGFGEHGGESCDVNLRKATIGAVLTSTLSVRCDGQEWNVRVYPNQCRRLVKKERRKVWINEIDIPERHQDMARIIYGSQTDSRSANPRKVEFIEVKRK